MRVSEGIPPLMNRLPDTIRGVIRGITYIPARVSVQREESTCTLRAELVFSHVDNIRFTVDEFAVTKCGSPALMIVRPLAEFAERFEDGRTGIRDLVDQ